MVRCHPIRIERFGNGEDLLFFSAGIQDDVQRSLERIRDVSLPFARWQLKFAGERL